MPAQLAYWCPGAKTLSYLAHGSAVPRGRNALYGGSERPLRILTIMLSVYDRTSMYAICESSISLIFESVKTKRCSPVIMRPSDYVFHALVDTFGLL